jgi:DNA-binding response OmpR family regulator
MRATSGAHILLVEDEVKTADWIRLYLDRAGMTVSLAADGRAALAEAARRPPDLVLLDVLLPGLGGFEVCRALRSSSEVPVILLTARAAEHDRLRGFELGADDYIVKPFSPRELVARVSAVLRRTRSHGGAQGALIVGRLTHRTDALEVECEGHTVKLTPIESRLLGVLMSAPHRIFTRAELVSRVLGDDYAGSDRTIDAHVKNLRRKLDMLPSRLPAIETTHGVGYRLAAGAGSDAPDA